MTEKREAEGPAGGYREEIAWLRSICSEHMKDGPGWAGGVGGGAPVQGVGIVDGLDWYFRSRYSEWEFHVADKPNADPLNGAWSTGDVYDDSDFGASWISTDEAWAFIERGIAEFRAHLASEQPAAGPSSPSSLVTQEGET